MKFFCPPHFRRWCASLLLALAAVAWVPLAAPFFLAVPDDFHHDVELVAHDNFYDPDREEFAGEQVSKARIAYDVVERQGRVASVRVAFDVHRPNGEPIFSTARTYGIDRVRWQHDPSGADRERQGYLFGPRFADKADFLYWHVNYDSPAPMKFVAEEEIEGLRVYRYEASYHADQTADLGHLLGVGEARGVNLDVRLQLWIEPVSGMLVQHADQSTAYFYDLSTGQRLAPWNRFRNTYTPESVQASAAIARAVKFRTQAIVLGVPGVLLLLAIAIPLSRLFALRRPRAWVPSLLPALALLTVCALLTGAFWVYLRVITEQRVLASFQADTLEIERLFTERLSAYASVLEGAKGFLESSPTVDREAWRRYVAALRPAERLPGVQGVGYAQRVTSAARATYVRNVQRDGFPGFDIVPSGEREEYFPITFLEPFDYRNQRAFGYDMASEPIRRSAMATARDLGLPVLSDRVTLVQETGHDVQAGFLLYVPVYRPGAPLDTVAQRREALTGYAYAPFRMANFINALLPAGSRRVNIEIFDGGAENIANAELRMYTSIPSATVQAMPRFRLVRSVRPVGHEWTVVFSSVPGYGVTMVEERMPSIFLGVSILFFVAISTTLFFAVRGRWRAERQTPPQIL